MQICNFFFADSKSRAQELSNDVLFVIFGHQTWDLEGGGQIDPPPAYLGFQVPSRDRVNLYTQWIWLGQGLTDTKNYILKDSRRADIFWCFVHTFNNSPCSFHSCWKYNCFKHKNKRYNKKNLVYIQHRAKPSTLEKLYFFE